jgi:hypothetical protein
MDTTNPEQPPAPAGRPSGAAPSEDADGWQNTSGMGKDAVVPNEIRKFNVGAFLSPAIWGLGNRVYIGPSALVLALVVASMFVVPRWGALLQLPASVVVGMYGNVWAWKGRRWNGIEHFLSVQRRWIWIAIAANVAAFVILSLVGGADAPSEVSVGTPRSFSTHGVSFEYPGNWEHSDEGLEGSLLPAGILWRDSFVAGAGSVVLIVGIRLPQPVTPADIDREERAFEREIERGFRREGSRIVMPAARATLGSLAGFELTVSPVGNGQSREIHVVLGISGSTMYGVYCSSTVDSRAAMLDGCAGIVRSFRVD